MQATRVEAMIPLKKGPPRSGGVHLSGILRGMAAQYGFLDKKWVDDLKLVEVAGHEDVWWAALDDVSKLRMAIGMAWEAWYLPQVPGVVHQPGEMCVEGVYMTHDGESLDVVMSERERRTHYVLSCHEVKSTAKSINTVGDLAVTNPKNWLWLMQIKGYCKGLGTQVAYLHILYLHGDYSYPIRPQLHMWRLEFTEEEIADAWFVVQRHLIDNQQQYQAQLEAADLMMDTDDASGNT